MLRLSYRFEPGHPHDGVSVHVPLKALPQLKPDGFEWLVPALRLELVTTLLRSLPKELRRPLVPIPDVAVQVLGRLVPRREPLLDALTRELGAARGVQVRAGSWDLSRLPAHLRMTFVVEAEDGEVLAEGEDLDAVRAAVRPRLRSELAAATSSVERHGLRDWDGIGTLPRVVTVPGTGDSVRAYPALVDEGETVGVRPFETPAAQAAAMHAGTRRLLSLTIPSPVRFVEQRLDNAAKLALLGAPHGSLSAVVADAALAAIDELMASGGGPAWDEEGFAVLRGHVAGELAPATARVVGQVVRILTAFREVQRRLDDTALAAPLREARLDVAGQIGGLVYDGFVAATGVDRLADVERYLRAAALRLERLPAQVAVDADRMRVVHELDALRRATPGAPAEVRWLLEELRVSYFAQGLGVRGQVSAKRIRRRDAATRV